LEKNGLLFDGALAEMITELLSRGNSVRMNIKGNSMSPTIRLGDIVTLRPIRFENIKKGNVVACRINPSDSTLTLHRVIKRKKNFIVTKGDASRYGDPPTTNENIFGKARLIERNGRIINLETRYHHLSSHFIAWFSWGLAVIKEVLVNPAHVMRKIFKNQ